MITWYELAIGARANARFGNVAVISNDRANHRLALSSYGVADDPERPSHVGLHHIAFEYPGLKDAGDLRPAQGARDSPACHR